MEVLPQEPNAKFMTTRRPRSLYAVGADMDPALVRTLTPGDHVLMEVNGGRFWTALKNPMAVEDPWEVVENSVAEKQDRRLTGQLILKHPKVAQPFVLSYDNMLKLDRGEPAVFFEKNPETGGALYVILQMVAFRLPEDRLEQFFSTALDLKSFEDGLDDDRVKVGIFEQWAKAFRGVEPNSWTIMGVNRISLLARVKTTVIHAIRHLDYAALLKIPNDELVRVRQACKLLPMLLQQADLIHHAPSRTFVKPEPEGSKAEDGKD